MRRRRKLDLYIVPPKPRERESVRGWVDVFIDICGIIDRDSREGDRGRAGAMDGLGKPRGLFEFR